MKKQILNILSIVTPMAAMAQWTTSGNDISNTNSGNVGIGTANPVAKLDVAGSLNIGSTNSLNFGGIRQFHISGTQNLFLGSDAGNAITTGYRNVFIGFQSGASTNIGTTNAFIGYQTGQFNTSGSDNIFFGNRSGYQNQTGSKNNFIGYQAGLNNLSGENNSYFGYQAGMNSTTGSNNISIGTFSGQSVGSANNNVFVGRSAGQSSTGSNNTFIGRIAGQSNTHGAGNTYIGSNARGNADLTNATAIGIDALVTQSNSLVLGNNANIGIGVSAPSQKLHVAGNARITGAIFDSNNEAGIAGQVLSTSVTGTDWVSMTGMPVGTTGQTLINTNGTWSANGNFFNNGTNVGIGTGIPSAKLHVVGDARITGNIMDRNNEAGAAGQVLSSTGAGTDWVTMTGLPVGALGYTLYNNGGSWLSGISLYNNGTNVGIGTDAPASKLHVNGDVSVNGALRDSNNDPGLADFVLTSNGSGTDWKDVCTIVMECDGIGPSTGGWGYDSVAVSGTNGESTYLFQSNSIVANIDDVSGSMVFSAKGVGYNGSPADATRMTYMPSMAAFRAGTDDQGNWNPENQGYGSAAFGRNTVAVGDYTVASGLDTRSEGTGSVAFGQNTRAIGSLSMAMGYQTETYGDGAFAAGTFNVAEGSNSAVFGYENYGAGAFSFAAGQGNMALTYAETVLGFYATQQEGSAYSPQSTDRVFAIGNGLVGARSNAMVVLKNGNTGVGVNSPQFKLDVGGDSQHNGVRIGRGNGGISSNTMIGASSFGNNTTGNLNTVVGAFAMPSNTTGSANSGLGYYSLYYGSTGSNNSGLGYSAGDYTYLMSNATFFGAYANTNSSSGLSNFTAMGYDSKATASNQVRIGNSSVTSIGGQVQWTTVSDKRFKENVKEDVKGLDFILRLKPVTYNLDVDRISTFLGEGRDRDTTGKEFIRTSSLDAEARAQKEQIRYTGFLAQDVEQAAKDAGYDFSGVDAPQNEKSLYGLRYAEFTVPLVKAVQELNEKVSASSPENVATKTELEAAKAEISELRALVNRLLDNQKQFEGDLQQCCFGHSGMKGDEQTVAGANDSPSLEQNQPNPFHENTTIRYYLPSGTHSASIAISDMNGVQLKTFDLSGGRGAGQVLIGGGAFAAGTYVYTLTVNGKQVDSKRLMLL
jgi:hypothetical protein